MDIGLKLKLATWIPALSVMVPSFPIMASESSITLKSTGITQLLFTFIDILKVISLWLFLSIPLTSLKELIVVASASSNMAQLGDPSQKPLNLPSTIPSKASSQG